MNPEPSVKRTIAFVDRKNLFQAAREAFGYTYPNDDAQEMASAVCRAQGWSSGSVRFYTGIPDESDNGDKETGEQAAASVAREQSILSVPSVVHYTCGRRDDRLPRALVLAL